MEYQKVLQAYKLPKSSEVYTVVFFQQRYDIPSSKPKTPTHPKQFKATLSTSPYIQPRYNLSIHSLILKFTAISLLMAASTALASPFNVRSESLKLTGLTAKSSKLGDSNIQFSLTDPNYPEDTPTDCAVKWWVHTLDPRPTYTNSLYKGPPTQPPLRMLVARTTTTTSGFWAESKTSTSSPSRSSGFLTQSRR